MMLHAFTVLVMLFFGIMAYYPLVLDPGEYDLPPHSHADDVVVSVSPTPLVVPATAQITDEAHPLHRPAA